MMACGVRESARGCGVGGGITTQLDGVDGLVEEDELPPLLLRVDSLRLEWPHGGDRRSAQRTGCWVVEDGGLCVSLWWEEGGGWWAGGGRWVEDGEWGGVGAHLRLGHHVVVVRLEREVAHAEDARGV